jgi:hypothetical protein
MVCLGKVFLRGLTKFAIILYDLLPEGEMLPANFGRLNGGWVYPKNISQPAHEGLFKPAQGQTARRHFAFVLFFCMKS